MQQVQDNLIFPIDTPSDAELMRRFADEARKLEVLRLQGAATGNPIPWGQKLRDTKPLTTRAARKGKRKAQRKARARARA